MKKYEVVIIGAGPAGCQCARLLTQAGKRVLLVEKSKDFSTNNYSSGGAPLSIMKEYRLPEKIISSYWNQVGLYSSHHEHLWKSNMILGVVLDFMKLRSYLSQEASQKGGTLYLGCSYQHHEHQNGKTLVHLKHHEAAGSETIETDVIVDASGAERSVLAKENYDKSKAMAATGIEYHVEVDATTYHKYASTLSFFIGQRWMPQGYAWIFPIQPNVLKIGVIRYFLHQHIVPHDASIRHYLDQMIERCFHSGKLPVHDKHGKTLFYTYGQHDSLYKNNVIAIGDSISTLNPLASEGIRHAMASANIAAEHIVRFLDRQQGFDAYPQDLRRYFGMKWKMSEMIMNRLYRQPDDHKLDLMLGAFRSLTVHELLALGFDYKFGKAAKFTANYAFLLAVDKLRSLLGSGL